MYGTINQFLQALVAGMQLQNPAPGTTPTQARGQYQQIIHSMGMDGNGELVETEGHADAPAESAPPPPAPGSTTPPPGTPGQQQTPPAPRRRGRQVKKAT